MRLFRFLVVLVFVLVAGVYAGFYFVNQARLDQTIPEITFAAQVLDVPVDADEAALLMDVKAIDGKDGDITNRVIVEKISNFVEKGLSNITYAVVDSDRHTVKATRRVRYVDYRSPRFTFSRPMRFDVGTNFNILQALGAVDMIDGDISDKVKLIGSDLSVNAPGTYMMQAQVTNSKGDVSYLRFNVTMKPAQRQTLQVNLTEYLVYLKQGEALNPSSYIGEVTLNTRPVTEYTVDISPDIDTAFPGVYQAVYKASDGRGNTGETELTVIVEE